MRSSAGNPLVRSNAGGGFGVIDGGLATELEARGHDLSNELWSARLLFDQPDEIAAVHRAYLEAGADVLVTASYQASFEGFERTGRTREEASALLQRSVELARAVRDQHRPEALVAASVGPYGAVLADGSEYRGDYGLGEDQLYEFHRERWHALASCGADLLACETIPSGVEARALARLLAERNAAPAKDHEPAEQDDCQDPPVWSWFTFSCRDRRRLRDGTDLASCVEILRPIAGVAGIGVNCVDPADAEELVRLLRSLCDLPVLVYPNSGEHWDASRRTWTGRRDPCEFADRARRWHAAGADWIGGCCRTDPGHVSALRELADRT